MYFLSVHLINTSPHIKPLEDLASLRSILSGAAPLRETDVDRFKDVTNGRVDIFQAYGMTETSPLAIIQTKEIEGGIKIGGSGYLVPNTQAKFVSIEDPDNQDALGVKQSGEIMIRGPQVCEGCYRNVDSNKTCFRL